MRVGGIFLRPATACHRAKIERPARRHAEQGIYFPGGGVRPKHQLNCHVKPRPAGALLGGASPSSLDTRPEDHINNARIELAGESSVTRKGTAPPEVSTGPITCHAQGSRCRLASSTRLSLSVIDSKPNSSAFSLTSLGVRARPSKRAASSMLSPQASAWRSSHKSVWDHGLSPFISRIIKLLPRCQGHAASEP